MSRLEAAGASIKTKAYANDKKLKPPGKARDSLYDFHEDDASVTRSVSGNHSG